GIGWDHPHAVQVVARGPGLVPGTERGAFGALGEPAGRTRPRLAAAATGPPVSGDVMVEQVLRVPPEEPVDNLAGYGIVDHDLLPQSGRRPDTRFNLGTQRYATGRPMGRTECAMDPLRPGRSAACVTGGRWCHRHGSSGRLQPCGDDRC